MKRTQLRSALLTAAVVIGAVLGWLYLAPTQIGGSTTYVVTSGISMAPRFHTDDLALVRPATRYRVGEIVAYHSSLLHVTVLHRIIARDGDRYVFKGDNNNFVDPTHPGGAELVGALWLRVPHGGRVLAWLHSPLTAAGLCGAAALLLVMGPGGRRRRRDRRRNMPNASSRQRAELVNMPDNADRRHVNFELPLIVAAVAALVFVGLGVVAFTRPLQKAASVGVPYTQRVTFSYGASAPIGQAYPSGVVSTGDPIFLQLVHRVGVQVRYQVATEGQHQLSGTEDVVLRVTGPTGWVRNIRLAPRTHFTGDETGAQVTLDLTSLNAMLERLQMETGVSAGGGYTFAVVPQVHISGTVAGQPVNSNFAPVLNFQLQSLQLQPSGSLTPSQRASVATAATVSNRLGVDGHTVAVATGRWIALGGFLLAAGSALLLTILVTRGRSFDDARRIQAQYGHLIVPIAGTADDLAWAPFDVPTIKALVRLAENSERLILHYRDDTSDTYLVNDEGTIYRYQARPSGVVWGEWSSASPKPLVSHPASRPAADAFHA